VYPAEPPHLQRKELSVAKHQNAETVEITDPERVFFTLAVTDEEWRLLKADHHCKQYEVSVRAMGYYLVQIGEEAGCKESNRGHPPINIRLVRLEVTHVPSKR
jgi:hypothetical protein